MPGHDGLGTIQEEDAPVRKVDIPQEAFIAAWKVDV
jgi:hypothetical protein